MTVKQYVRENGWQIDCIQKTGRAMNVDIGFINDENQQDETEFGIKAYAVEELSDLFKDFCLENGFPQNTVTYIVVVQMADKVADLE